MIKKVIWIDKNVFNEENQGYKKIMETELKLKVNEYNDARLGIEAIKKEETYSPVFIITSGSIYPEFYRFFKSAVTYIKNLPVQIIFTSSTTSFLNNHKNDEIGRQMGRFYNLGGVTDMFPQVREFIQKTQKKLKDFKVQNIYTYERSQDFTGIQTFSYIKSNESFIIPPFYKDILNQSPINYNEVKILVNHMLTTFGNERICELIKGMILFNDIPEPILSKFFARAYTLESSFYGIMNQNLMKKNFDIYSTYIKLLYKGIINNSYKPKTDCTLYRGTRLEGFEIKFLKEMLAKKKEGKSIPIVYSTSFLSFSTSIDVSKGLSSRRESSPQNREVIFKLLPLSSNNENKIMKTNAFLNQISAFHNENEVLFFPYSSFELVDINENYSLPIIVFDYSLRFKEKVNNNKNKDFSYYSFYNDFY